MNIIRLGHGIKGTRQQFVFLKCQMDPYLHIEVLGVLRAYTLLGKGTGGLREVKEQ